MSRRLLLLGILASLAALNTEAASTLRSRRQAEVCEEATDNFDECTNAAYDDYKAAFEAGDDGKPDWMARKACNYMTAAVEECGDELIGDCYSEEDVINMKDHQLRNVLEVLEKSVEEWDTEKCEAVRAHVERVKALQESDDEDFDDDGIINDLDYDDDNDGIEDDEDEDDDNDGIMDGDDEDDDNDGVPDIEDNHRGMDSQYDWPVNCEHYGDCEYDGQGDDNDGVVDDEDYDGIPDEEDDDDDNDGIPDEEDNDDDNDGIPDVEDDDDDSASVGDNDNDGVFDDEDDDDDNDGILDDEDIDDDNDGIPDDEDNDDDNDEDSGDGSEESSADVAGLSLALCAIVIGRFV